MKINPLSGRALYRQVADDLRRRIERGELPAGEELPSEAELEDEYGVGAGTMRRALPILAREGLLVAERGQRHRVAERHEPNVVIVSPGARVVARVARPADAQAHAVPEGEYIVVVIEGDRERVYLAARTELQVPPPPG